MESANDDTRYLSTRLVVKVRMFSKRLFFPIGKTNEYENLAA